MKWPPWVTSQAAPCAHVVCLSASVIDWICIFNICIGEKFPYRCLPKDYRSTIFCTRRAVVQRLDSIQYIADICSYINTVDYPKFTLQSWLEDPIERALSVCALIEVEDAFDDFLALLEVSCPHMSEAWGSILRFPLWYAGAVIYDGVVLCCSVSGVEARIFYFFWTWLGEKATRRGT